MVIRISCVNPNLVSADGLRVFAGLLALGGVAGLQGWQWLFLMEGLPSMAVGAFILLTLADSPLKVISSG